MLLSSCISRTIPSIEKRLCQAEYDLLRLWEGVEEPIVLTIDEAIDMALERNLELLVKEHELAVQQETATAVKFKMMPKLIANAEDSIRSHPLAAFSESLQPGVPPAPLSISAPKKIRTYDITLAWNILDFGLSYYRARQETNKVTVQELEYERLAQSLILKVVKAYYLVAGDQVVWEHATAVKSKMEQVKAAVGRHMASGEISQAQGAAILNQILTNQDDMEVFFLDGIQNLADFKNLLGLPPSLEVRLVTPEPTLQVGELPPIEELEQTALITRPELYSDDIKERVWRDEVIASILQIFPELTPFISANFDGNRFLLFNRWWVAGIRASYNLLAAPLHIAEARTIEQQIALTHANRLMMSLTVISQVRLASLTYLDQLDRFRVMKEMYDARNLLYQVAKKRYDLGALGDVEEVLTSYIALEGEYKMRRAWAQLKGSLEQVNNAVGVPLYFKSEDKL